MKSEKFPSPSAKYFEEETNQVNGGLSLISEDPLCHHGGNNNSMVHLRTQVSWAEQCDIQTMYVVCHGQNHYCGGTSLGKKYWTQHPHVPEEFLLAVNVGTVQSNTHVLFK